MSIERQSAHAREFFADRPFVVVVPASVAFDRDKMEKITREILGRVGCPDCHSGRDIRFELERNFFVDEKLQIRPAFAEPMPGIR